MLVVSLEILLSIVSQANLAKRALYSREKERETSKNYL